MPRSSSEETLDENRQQNQQSNQNNHNDRTDDGETGEKSNKQDGGSVGFWNSELKSLFLSQKLMYLFTALILSTFVLGILSLYWAALFRVEQNLGALVVYVVDFDGMVAPYTDVTPVVGPQIVSAAEALVAPSGSLGWVSLPASDFNYDPIAVRQAIYDQKAWAAVIINPNATALLQNAVQNGNTSYDPMGAAQIVYVQARDETTHANYVTPQLTMFEMEISSMFGKMWAGQVLTMAASSTTIMSNIEAAPQAVNPAIAFSTYNLRPFYPPVATPAITIGLIYLIIISFFSFSFYLPTHMKFIMSPGHRPLHFWQLIIWRWCATVLAYFFLSVFYSLISVAFQIPFSSPPASETMVANPATAYHYGSFLVYWMVNWVGMIALGLACENVAMVIGQPWTAFWLIFWVITNVSTSFYSITLAPHFYYWGYAWPLHNIVEASRTILFDIHSRIGLNFGVLFAWVAVNTVLFPLCCWFMRWKTMREKKKEAQSKEQ
ncbi:Nitrosoguanidine resistance protein SNG1 [Lachnellula suecica]|uniref:Nitrosoguanidine resistance protein SNG1 n=1 Tax=Lachnellula suecica TaxID=602035 RepID=A0A8T9C343_9HELO|nr:Nitrosoguanidine resistance protein SNG1 [Lachnellula suecica]